MECPLNPAFVLDKEMAAKALFFFCILDPTGFMTAVIFYENSSKIWDLTLYSDDMNKSSNPRLLSTEYALGIHQLMEPALGFLVLQSSGFV